jgi:hypothetical protein
MLPLKSSKLQKKLQATENKNKKIIFCGMTDIAGINTKCLKHQEQLESCNTKLGSGHTESIYSIINLVSTSMPKASKTDTLQCSLPILALNN